MSGFEYAYEGGEDRLSDYHAVNMARRGWRRSGGDPTGGSLAFSHQFDEFQAEALVVSLDSGEYEVLGEVVSPEFC